VVVVVAVVVMLVLVEVVVVVVVVVVAVVVMVVTVVAVLFNPARYSNCTETCKLQAAAELCSQHMAQTVRAWCALEPVYSLH
jgi:hypothetical protein